LTSIYISHATAQRRNELKPVKFNCIHRRLVAPLREIFLNYTTMMTQRIRLLFCRLFLFFTPRRSDATN